MRKVTDVAANRSDIERKVRKATSNKPYGPTGTQMSEIADATYHQVEFQEIMNAIWKRLNEPGKYWRHVYKALTLLEYIIKNGDEQVVNAANNNIYVIETLKDFALIDKDDVDQGKNVRVKAKRIVVLLKDPEELASEREKAAQTRSRFGHKSSGGSSGAGRSQSAGAVSDSAAANAERKRKIREAQEKEKRELDEVMEASKRDYENQQKSIEQQDMCDPDLQAALALSRAADAAKQQPPQTYGSSNNDPFNQPQSYNNNADPFASSNNNNSSDPFAPTQARPRAQTADPFTTTTSYSMNSNNSNNNNADPFGGSSSTSGNDFFSQQSQRQSQQQQNSSSSGGDFFSRQAATSSDPFSQASSQPSAPAASPAPAPWDSPSPATATNTTASSSGNDFFSQQDAAQKNSRAPAPWDAPSSKPATQSSPAPWDAPAQNSTPTATDAWGSSPTPAASTPSAWDQPTSQPLAKPASDDAWSTSAKTPQQQIADMTKNSRKIDEFSSVSSSHDLGAAASSSPNAWDMKPVSDALPPFPSSPPPAEKNDVTISAIPAEVGAKKGSNWKDTKNLVNLDALVTSSPQPKANSSGSTPMNPFALPERQASPFGGPAPVSPNMGIGYQQPPMGYQQQPPMGYQQQPPMGYQQQPPMGYQQQPQMGYQQQPQMGYQQQPQMMGGNNMGMMNNNNMMMGGGMQQPQQPMYGNQMMQPQQQQQQQQRGGGILTPTKNY